MLKRLIEDLDWNRSELLREFHSNWAFLCDAAGTVIPVIYFLGSDDQDALQVKMPNGTKGIGLTGNYLALSNRQMADKNLETFRDSVRWQNRPTVGKAITLKIEKTEPAPGRAEDVFGWYLRALDHLDQESRDDLQRFRKHPGKEFWLLFSIPVNNSRTWVAIQFQDRDKRKLPIAESDLRQWTVTPRIVRSLTRETLIPRGGGSLDLQDRSILLVGCGSVGSEIAHRLGGSGAGTLTIADNYRFSEENLYRHTLEVRDIGYTKCSAVARDIRLRCPWVRIETWPKRLENLHDRDLLEKFDLVVVAIGSPTLERSFHDFAVEAAIDVPVVNAWVEACGIGGHATLDIPGKPGCLNCAYVDPDTLTRGLASNLNFLEPNQDVTRSHGGCGDLFLPYSSVAAGYTAVMATDLAIRHLLGQAHKSSKVSWQGDAAEAERNGLSPSHRYHQFAESLQILDLHNENCDVCAG